MYSSARPSVNGGAARAGLLAGLAGLAVTVLTARVVLAHVTDGLAYSDGVRRSLDCDVRLKALFTPPRPQLGRYEACATDEPVAALAKPGWRIDSVSPLDAFGAAGSFDRSALARLYGGRRAAVARGWIEHEHCFEAVTLISPHPDETLTRLLPGTLIIRHVIIRTRQARDR